MNKILAIFAGVFVASAFASELPRLALPVAPHGWPVPAHRDDAWVVVSLSSRGEVFFDLAQAAFGDRQSLRALAVVFGNPAPSVPVSLQDLSQYLNVCVVNYDLLEQKKGRSGYEDERKTASRLFVLLRADKDAPWAHVSWVLGVLREHRLYKIQLSVRRGADDTYTDEEVAVLGVGRAAEGNPPALLDAFLPKPGTARRKETTTVTVRGEVERPVREWRGKKVSVPTSVVYFLNALRAKSAPALDQMLAQVTQAEVRIKVDSRVPFKYVVLLLDKLAAADVAAPRWRGPVASQAIREAATLPYPEES